MTSPAVRPLALRLHFLASAMGHLTASDLTASDRTAAARILVVDDEESIRDVMARILDGLGYWVTVTGDGFEALWWLETQPYHLVISDLRMPGLDGPALYNEILARWPTGGPRVVFTSGFAEISQYEASAPRDVPLLFKPLTIDGLRDAVARVLTPG